MDLLTSDNNDPGNVPGPEAEQPGWLDTTKKYVNSLFGPSTDRRPAAPAVDMARWGPVLEAANLGPDSPEHKLLTAISGHVNSAPVPREDSGWSKAIGVLGNAASAGFLRRAGASAAETQAPMNSMIADWRGRRDAADGGRMKAWEAGGNLMIPGVSSAVQSAQQQKRLEQTANIQAQNYGLPTPYPTRTPQTPQGASPASVSQPLATTPAGQANGPQGAPSGANGVKEAWKAIDGTVVREPGREAGNWQELVSNSQHAPIIQDILKKHGVSPTDWQAGARVVAQEAGALGAQKAQLGPMGAAAPPQPPPQQQQAPAGDDPERAHRVGNVSFYTPQWANQFKHGMTALLASPGAGISIPVKKDDGTTVKEEIKTPADLERVALQEDEKSYRGGTAYKARETATLKETEGVVASNQEALKGYQTAAKAATVNNNVIGLMDQALQKAQSSGQLGVGTGNMILGPINAVLERLGAPHLQQGALTMIKELQNRAGVEASNEEVNSGRGPGQRIMQTFLNAVPGADMTESGFVAASAAIKAINAYHVATGQVAEQLLKEPGSHSRRDLQTEVAKRAQPYFDEAVKAAQAAIDAGVAPKPGGAKPGAAQGAAPLEAAQSSEIQKRWQSATPDKRASIEAWLKVRGYDPQEVLKGGGAAPQKARPQAQPRPDQTEELNRLRQLGLGLP